MFENDWIHGSVISLKDELGWHQCTLTHTHTQNHTQMIIGLEPTFEVTFVVNKPSLDF